MHEMASDLQVAGLSMAQYRYLKIEGLHGPGMMFNGGNEVVKRWACQPQNSAAGDSGINRIRCITCYLFEPL
ncbi:hypothetical protein D3C84_1127770 [compost metagenome]